MHYRINRKGKQKEIHYEVCHKCKKQIYGKVYIADHDGHMNFVVVAKKHIVGICIGQGWIEYYECLPCFKKRKEESDESV